MKILITVFLCTFIFSVHSKRYNSSLLESKMIGGYIYKDKPGIFTKPLMASIIYKEENPENPETPMELIAMGTFFTERSVLTSKKCVLSVMLQMGEHYVVKMPTNNEDRLPIEDAGYTSEKQDKSLRSYGVIKLCADAGIDTEMSLMPLADTYYEGDNVVYSPGLVTGSQKLILSYLTLKFWDPKICQEKLYAWQYALRDNEICLAASGGVFEERDDGTPLYSAYDKVLGIASSFEFQGLDIIIYTNLAHQKKRIEDFLAQERMNIHKDGADSDIEHPSHGSDIKSQRRERWHIEKVFRSQTQNAGEGSSSHAVDSNTNSGFQMISEDDSGFIRIGQNHPHITPYMGTFGESEFGCEQNEFSGYLNTENPTQEYSMSPELPNYTEEFPRFRRDNDEATVTCNIMKFPFGKLIKKLKRSTSKPNQ